MTVSWLGETVPLVTASLAIEALVGYPDGLFRLIGHPVTWMGRLLAVLERGLNRSDWGAATRRSAGLLALAILLAATGTACLLATWLLPGGWTGFACLAILCASLPAQRSLDRHVQAVADALACEGLAGGRRAVSMIVGRNPASLDEAGVARAAIESLAENFADGVVGPALWVAIGGLAGGALYKAVNTADSMIGHRNARYTAFGWAAARLDDLVNLPVSRFSAFLLVGAGLLAGRDSRSAWTAMWRDAARHRSPNAGWPEAAMAGALGLKLGGPRTYGDAVVDDAFMGDGRLNVGPADIRDALRLYRIACALQGTCLLGLALAVLR